MACKAATIIRQALAPDAVLFSFPLVAFTHRAEAYKTITDQIGPLASIRPLSNYDQRARKDLLISVTFTSPEHTKKAIDSGITVDDVVYKATPNAPGAENPLMRVQLNLLHNADDRNLKEDLLSSLRYYGKVYQIRRILCNGYFEGQLTVTLDPSAGYKDDKGVYHEAQPLQRMLYLEAWDVYAPASFKGAAPICYYCRQSGHIRNACPELMKRVCFGCGNKGHTIRFCKNKEPEENTDTDLLQEYEDAQQQHTLEKTTSGEEDQASESPALQETVNEQIENTAEDMPDNISTKKDDAMDVDVSDERAAQKSKECSVDPSEGINASKHAPITVATHMRIDSQAEMLEITSVKQNTKAKNEKVKRSLLTNSTSSSQRPKASSLDLNLVIPKHKPKDSARRA
ncbi:hypothetical protein RO3G_01610 [Lichtheimia corymbifera JMRC:FSU:9682]|uniref:CCHC-type domain-containing protein n=1 Tax=Lichtheimia corymbifera JMRC:FSU:9682 TaxID=1263082 RepID=A0A068SIH5_9FUNG|nr:hypothetical protein RO3G_01610 [Lichtheimia corymbifera JMRC:FSU:9682]